jgi:hypothetical protein
LNCLVNCLLATIVAGALFLGHESSCPAQGKTAASELQEPHYKCDTPGVQLEGLLTQRTFYGPPGFGETPAKDARERVLILKLAKPITVDPIENVKANHGSCWATFPHLKQIQLFIFPPDKALRARKLVGKTVVAIGALHEGDAPSEHTRVVMDVKTIDSK